MSERFLAVYDLNQAATALVEAATQVLTSEIEDELDGDQGDVVERKVAGIVEVLREEITQAVNVALAG